ncbi:MAG: anhydro-N-acetylmuramic acid kinase [Caldimonas sp.]
MTNYIGLMSGTSLDGVDGTLVAFGESDADLQVRAHAHRPFDGALRSELLALNTPGPAELHRAALAANALVGVYAEVVKALLEESGTSRQQVRAIGAHGQTVRHRPGEFDGIGYTVQLNAPALLAEHAGIDVVADFRSRDVAAGGTGAPLVPAFHRALFGRPDATVAVLNLGGIANLTVLHRDGRTIGFDCGPANVLMDLWMHRHSGVPFDADGAWAASGTVVPSLLALMQADPYFTRSPPKSTGRDLFDAAWLERHLRAAPSSLRAQDVQATLAELTAQACGQDMTRHASDARDLLVCGGGALNSNLMTRLARHLPHVLVRSTDRAGLPANQVEACAFAWLARASIERKAGNVPEVTGANGLRVLGALYPADIRG